uniref:Uncharacterized protein n=1 Tax=viral metagenome TaxID=1070528 RepID=A0A6C0BKS7_9ZZZZ
MSQQCIQGLQGTRGPSGIPGNDAPPNPLDVEIISLNTSFISEGARNKLGPLISVMDRPFNTIRSGRNVVFSCDYPPISPDITYILGMGSVILNIQQITSLEGAEVINCQVTISDNAGSVVLIGCDIMYSNSNNGVHPISVEFSNIAISGVWNGLDLRDSIAKITDGSDMVDGSDIQLIDSCHIDFNGSSLGTIASSSCLLNDVSIQSSNTLTSGSNFLPLIIRPVFYDITSINLATDTIIDAVLPNVKKSCNNSFNIDGILTTKGYATTPMLSDSSPTQIPRDAGLFIIRDIDNISLDLTEEYQGREIVVCCLSGNTIVQAVGGSFQGPSGITTTLQINQGVTAVLQMDLITSTIYVTSLY